MTEFSGQGGRMSNNEGADESSLDYPADDDTTADDTTSDDTTADDVATSGAGPVAGEQDAGGTAEQ